MEPPVEPDQADCCNTGCKPCILDVYDEQLQKYKAGLLQEDNLKKSNCISPSAYSIFELIEIEPVSDEANLYTFLYIKPYRELNGPKIDELKLTYEPGQHFLLRGDFGSKNDQFTKAYTPIPVTNKPKLSFTTLIKLYEGGLMSQYLRKLRIGQQTVWRGPYGDYKLNYTFKHILFIAQGTGIAPIYSVIDNILNNDTCETLLNLFYCVRKDCDIYLRTELYNLLSYWNFKYEVFLSADDCVAKYNEVINKVRINENHIKTYLDNKNFENTHIVICGSDTFSCDIKKTVINLGFPEFNVFVF